MEVTNSSFIAIIRKLSPIKEKSPELNKTVPILINFAINQQLFPKFTEKSL